MYIYAHSRRAGVARLSASASDERATPRTDGDSHQVLVGAARRAPRLGTLTLLDEVCGGHVTRQVLRAGTKFAHSGAAARTTRSASANAASAVGAICGLPPSVFSRAAANAARQAFCGEPHAPLG